MNEKKSEYNILNEQEAVLDRKISLNFSCFCITKLILIYL